MPKDPIYYQMNTTKGIVKFRVTRIDSYHNVYGKSGDGESCFIGHATEMWYGKDLDTAIRAYRLG